MIKKLSLFIGIIAVAWLFSSSCVWAQTLSIDVADRIGYCPHLQYHYADYGTFNRTVNLGHDDLIHPDSRCIFHHPQRSVYQLHTAEHGADFFGFVSDNVYHGAGF